MAFAIITLFSVHNGSARAESPSAGPCGAPVGQTNGALSELAVRRTRRMPVPAPGDVLFTGGVSTNGAVTGTAEFYDVDKGRFVNAASMMAARAAHQALEFAAADEVLIAGGFGGSAVMHGKTLTLTIVSRDDGEVYNLTQGQFIALASQMQVADGNPDDRAFFPAVELGSGLGFFPGGLCNDNIRPTAQLFDPTSNGFELLQSDLAGGPRSFETATLLQDGTVLIAGGIDDFSGDTTASAEIYNPATNSFSLTAPMTVARAQHTATLLPDGTVLIAGGVTGSGGSLQALNSAELYNPVTQSFSPLASGMKVARAQHTATLLPDGEVLIAGGFSGTQRLVLTGTPEGDNGSLTQTSGAISNTAEIYSPEAQSFTCVGGAVVGGCQPSMRYARAGQTATLISAGMDAGDVLVAGGFGAKGAREAKGVTPLASTEFYLPASKRFIAGPRMHHPRVWQAAVTIH